MINSVSQLEDPKTYLESCCKIRTKTQGLQPFILNEAQKDLFNGIQKYNRIIILKARQIGFCLDKETKVLSNNLEWIKLKDVQVGQKLVSVDENNPGGKGRDRKMRTAVVEAKWEVVEESFKITMDDGRFLIATGQHRFMSKKPGHKDVSWIRVEDMDVGSEIRYVTKPWEDGDFEDGWFGGILDGEGCLRYKNHTGAEACAIQRVSPLLEQMQSYALKKSYSYMVEMDYRTPEDSSKLGNQPVGRVVFSRMDELFKLIGQTRPKRFIGQSWWEGKSLPGKKTGIGWSRVVSIEPLGKRTMIDLQTSTKTFIAEGFVSHNSTAVTGFFYHKTIVTPGVTTALIGYNSDLTAELLDKVKTFYRTTPDDLKPTIHYNSKYEVSFPKIDSKILVLPSTENVGRGYTINYALCTELAFWDKAEEKMMALENSVPITGKIVIESTPNGVGNLYHKTWMADDNGYEKLEYGWWWGYTEKEIVVIEKRMNNPQKFAQEYSLAFLASGRSVFGAESIERQRKNLLKVGDIVKLDDGTEHIVNEHEGFRTYKPPVAGRFYVCGVDVAEGVVGGDYSTIVIWDRSTGEEVGYYRQHIAPDKFADVLNRVGRLYNNALMVVEINNHGLTTVTCLKQLIYPSMYFRPARFESIGSPWSDKLGWKTTKLTRPLLIDDFAQSVRDDVLTIHSKELLDEMSVFVYNDSNDMQPQPGFHDDVLFAAAIGFQGFKVLSDKPMVQLDYQKHLPTVGY